VAAAVRIVTAAALGLATTATLGCRTPADDGLVGPLETLDQIGGRPRAVAVSGSRAFAAVGPRIVVLDVSDPARPRAVGRTGVLAAPAEDIAAHGDRVMAVGPELGLAVIDVARPAAPGLLDRLAPDDLAAGGPSFAPRAVAVGGGGILVAGDIGEGGAEGGHRGGRSWISRVVTVRRDGPSSLRVAGHAPFAGRAMDLVADGDRALVAAGRGGLRVFDVADPTAPRDLGAAPSPASAAGVAVAGGHAFVAEDDAAVAGVQVVDVRDPRAPREVASLELPRRRGTVPVRARRVAVTDGRAWLATSDGVWSLDIADPRAIRPLALAASPAPSRLSAVAAASSGTVDVATADGSVYALDAAGGLDVLARGAEGEWAAVGRWFTLARVTALAALPAGGRPTVDGAVERLVAISSDRPVLVDPARPLASGSVLPSGVKDPISSFTVAGGRLYAVTIQPPEAAGDTIETHGLEIVDLDTVGGPTPRSALHLSAYTFDPTDIAVLGDHAWAKLYDGAWLAIDVRDPAAPRVLGRVRRSGRGERLVTGGGRLYAAYRPAAGGAADSPRTRLEILDATAPMAPVVLGSIETEGAMADLVADGDLVFLISGSVLQIIDARDPDAPRVASRLALPGAGSAVSVGAAGRRRVAAVALGGAGVVTVDVTDPAAPAIVGRQAGGTAVADVAIGDGRLYAAGGDWGMRVVGAARLPVEPHPGALGEIPVRP